MSDNDKIAKLPVKFKQRGPEERSLIAVHEVGRDKCSHTYGCTYIVSEKLLEVECSGCGEKLNPMWVLTQLAHSDRRWAEAHDRYHDELKRLKERSRTKCDYCGKMTGISRR